MPFLATGSPPDTVLLFYFEGATDPSLDVDNHVLPGKLWRDTTGSPAVWKRRNDGDTDWDVLFDEGVATTATLGAKQALHANLTAFSGLTLIADRLAYANGSGTLALTTFTAAGRAIVDDATAADQRTTLGLGTIATLDSDTDGTLAANSDSKVATQKATKTYVDAKVAGLSWKQAVRAATTANGTLATAFENGDTIDGVTLATGDRILLKNQSTGAENGIYIVAASGAPTRATDADSGAELVNATVYVSEGTTLADTQWTCTTNAAITLGSTSLAFAQLSTGAGAILATIVDAKGDLIAATAADTVARLAAGSNGQVLSANSAQSTGLEWVTPAGGGGGGAGPGNAAITSKTANYTATSADYTILCDSSGGAFTISLPAAASNSGMILVVKKSDTSANLVTVDGNASETIDGALTYALYLQYEQVQIQCDGSNWVILDRYVPSVYMRVRKTSTQSIADAGASWTTVTWSSAVDDTHAMWTSGANTKITFKRPGFYLMGVRVNFPSGITGTFDLRVILNGSTSIPMDGPATQDYNANQFQERLNVSMGKYFAKDDYIEAQVYQQSGNSRNIEVDNEYPQFWAVLQP